MNQTPISFFNEKILKIEAIKSFLIEYWPSISKQNFNTLLSLIFENVNFNTNITIDRVLTKSKVKKMNILTSRVVEDMQLLTALIINNTAKSIPVMIYIVSDQDISLSDNEILDFGTKALDKTNLGRFSNIRLVYTGNEEVIYCFLLDFIIRFWFYSQIEKSITSLEQVEELFSVGIDKPNEYILNSIAYHFIKVLEPENATFEGSEYDLDNFSVFDEKSDSYTTERSENFDSDDSTYEKIIDNPELRKVSKKPRVYVQKYGPNRKKSKTYASSKQSRVYDSDNKLIFSCQLKASRCLGVNYLKRGESPRCRRICVVGYEYCFKHLKDYGLSIKNSTLYTTISRNADEIIGLFDIENRLSFSQVYNDYVIKMMNEEAIVIARFDSPLVFHNNSNTPDWLYSTCNRSVLTLVRQSSSKENCNVGFGINNGKINSIKTLKIINKNEPLVIYNQSPIRIEVLTSFAKKLKTKKNTTNHEFN
jgi:hypothetical protein